MSMIAAAVILAGCFCALIYMIHNDLNRTNDDVAADEAVIEAKPLNKALESIADCDVLMLGPQIAYAKAEAESFADGKPVVVISMADYGRMNAKAILAAARAALEA